MARQRYSIKESINRILRLFIGESTNELPGTLSGEILSEDAAWSDLAELFNNSLPNQTLTIPDALHDSLVRDGFSTGTVSNNLSTLQSESWFIPIAGVTDNQFNVVGELDTEASSQTSSYSTGFSSRNQHVFVLVNSITGAGEVIFSGTSVSETSAVSVSDDSESLTLDASTGQYYQTTKKWLEISGIFIGAGIAAINYDLGAVGYLDFGNVDFKLSGFRADVKTSGTAADVGVRIRKIQDDGSGKMSIVAIENMGFDSTVSGGSFVDSVRTGADDRSYTFGNNLSASDEFVVMKSADYNTYFSGDENILESSTKDEGLIIDFLGVPSGGISSVDHVTLTLFYSWGT